MKTIFLILLQLALASSSSNSDSSSLEEEDFIRDEKNDWISLVLLPLCSAGIFGLYSMLLRHGSPWSLMYSTAVSFSGLLPSLITVLGYVRLPWLVKSIFYCLRTQTQLSGVERMLMRRLWVVSGGFVGMGACTALLGRKLGQKRDMQRVLRYYTATVVSLGLAGLLIASAITLSLSKSARDQIIF